MKIEDVRILNWQSPGDQWWDGVRARPTEPLILGMFQLRLSWDEYNDLVRNQRVTVVAAAPTAPRNGADGRVTQP